jgi:Predicted transcription regulator containing HTH domain
MKTLTIDSISTREQYDTVRAHLNELITEATKKRMLEPEMDNDYIREIGRLARMSADYEDNYMDLTPLREKNPLIQEIETFHYSHNMKRKDVAELLEVNESVFSQIMNGKRKITMPLAKKLHEKLHISAETILKYS